MQKLSEHGSAAIHFRVPPAQLARIDRAAEREGLNRSAVIRKWVDAGQRARAIEHLIASVEAERT